MKEKLLVLFSLTLASSCQTAGEYFGRQSVVSAINNNCTAYKNGKLVDATNWIAVSPEDFEYLQDYYEDKEKRLFKCLKFGRCD